MVTFIDIILATESSSTTCLIFNAIAAVLCISCCLEIWILANLSLGSATVRCFKFVVELTLVAKEMLVSASRFLALYLESFFLYRLQFSRNSLFCTMYVQVTHLMVSKFSFSGLTCPFNDSNHAALPPSLLGRDSLKSTRLSNKLSKL